MRIPGHDQGNGVPRSPKHCASFLLRDPDQGDPVNRDDLVTNLNIRD